MRNVIHPLSIYVPCIHHTAMQKSELYTNKITKEASAFELFILREFLFYYYLIYSLKASFKALHK